MNISSLEQKLGALPPELQQEALDFIDFLLLKNLTANRKKNITFNFKWAGGLSDYKENFSSIELQHKSLEWR